MDKQPQPRKSAKRTHENADLCIVCRKYTGKNRNDRQPTPISSDLHQSLINFLQLPASFLEEKSVKCHVHDCQFASILKTKLTRPEGGFREDVEKLVDEFRGSQHCTCTCVTCSTNLQNVFLEGISHSEAVSRLSQLKGTCTFTFLPLHVVMAMNSEKQKQYLEQSKKMKYDLLQRDYLAATDQMKQNTGHSEFLK